MTAVEIFKTIKQSAKEGHTIDVVLSSKRKYTMVKELISRFEHDTKIDYDLGVITAEEFTRNISRVGWMMKSLEQSRESESLYW